MNNEMKRKEKIRLTNEQFISFIRGKRLIISLPEIELTLLPPDPGTFVKYEHMMRIKNMLVMHHGFEEVVHLFKEIENET